MLPRASAVESSNFKGIYVVRPEKTLESCLLSELVLLPLSVKVFLELALG